MNVSLNWVKRYLDVDMNPDEISEILTTIGLEVEGMDTVEAIKGGLQGVVIGEVLECGKHENADSLSVTSVDVGRDEPIQVVCGAPNVAKGQKVFVATVGTTLYTAEGEAWKIKKGKIRGEVSEGMICAEDELGIGKSHDGIMVLPEDSTVGIDARDYLKLENDIVYDIGLTPNRSDATSHIGVAKDLAAYLKINHDYNKEVKMPDLSSFHVETTQLVFDVDVQDADACPRYAGITIQGITVGDSPDWLKQKLGVIGVRSVNNVVDITNFILHEYGQPLHAFDASKVKGNKIIVKKLAAGSKFVTLDEQERSLLADDLMICDGEENPMCIAGVFGGIGSGVTEATKDIFLESAHFSAKTIRNTSTKHLLRTDAAKVFEKGSDPNICILALKRAAIMIKEICGGTISSEIIDEYPVEKKPVVIHLKYADVQRLMGTNITNDEIHEILRALNMQINPVDTGSIKVSVPTDKADVFRPVDLIEEILRIYGFNKIEIPSKISSTLSYIAYPSKAQIREVIAQVLASQGFYEMMNLSLIESSYYEEDAQYKDGLVYINNTSNIHLNIMRPEMLLSGLTSVRPNLNRQQSGLRLFEFGRSYKKAEEGFVETPTISVFLAGKQESKNWMDSNARVEQDYYSLKQVVHNVLTKLNIAKYQVSEIDDERWSFGMKYHRGNNTIVQFGKVNADHTAKMDVKEDVYYAEWNEEVLLNAVNQKVNIQEISKYPSTSRDLALVVDEHVTFDQIEKIAKKADKKILKSVQLFDIFRSKEHLGADKKSYAVNFVFENAEKTLNDKEVEKIMKNMTHQFENQIGALIRK